MKAFTWIDQWFDMDINAVREYEKKSQEETNQKVLAEPSAPMSDDDIDKLTKDVSEMD